MMPSFSRATMAAAALAAGTILAQPALAEMVMYQADLTGAAQVPPVDTAALGMSEITIDTDAMTISWTETHEGLTGEPTAAHFHAPASAEESAPPVVDILADLAAGSRDITPEQMEQIEAGMWYLNVHSAKYPNGEIRGQVVPADAAAE